MEDVLKCDFYESLLGYDNLNWFVNEVVKLENRMAFYFEKTEKVIVTTEKDEEDYRNTNIFRVCDKAVLSDKIRDHCHLTSENRGPAHNTCIINVTQKQKSYSF